MPEEGTHSAQVSGIGQNSWMRRMAQIGSEHGLFEQIGRNHFGLFVDDGDTLLVAFDTVDRARDGTSDGLPAGFEMVRRRSWSLLSILARKETWFLDASLARFFRSLADQGVFDGFSRVIFYGVGPDCGFAACSFARFAPGASVLAAGPIATLDPSRAPFERRFRSARRLPLTGPLGYGPGGLAKADQAFVLYDPTDIAAAAHGALYTGPQVTRVALPYAGRDFPRILHEAEACIPILRLIEKGEADAMSLRAVLKDTCRRNPGTMARRARAALVRGYPARATVIAEHGLATTGEKQFQALLSEAKSTKTLDRVSAIIRQARPLAQETPQPD